MRRREAEPPLRHSQAEPGNEKKEVHKAGTEARCHHVMVGSLQMVRPASMPAIAQSYADCPK
jgi:hypothetical protein